MPSTPAYTTIAQFILTVGGSGVGGKKAKTYIKAQNPSDSRLTTSPSLRPKENLDGRSGSPFIRRHVMQPIEVTYDVISETVPTDKMMLKAIVEPMLMQCKTHAQNAETAMEFTGTSKREGTRDTQFENGTPRSRAKAKICRDAPAMLVKLLTRLRRMRSEQSPDVLVVDSVAE